MHSPDPHASVLRKQTSLKDKKQLDLHLFKGSFMSSPRSACGNQTVSTAFGTDCRPANRFEQGSMTFSKANPQQEFQIKYEHKTKQVPKYREMPATLNFVDTSRLTDALLSPRYIKRNPITQGNDEKTQEWKPIAKRHEGSYKTTLFTSEEKPRARKQGEFNDVNRAPEAEVTAKPTGIRSFQHKPSLSVHEVVKRQLKDIPGSSDKNKPNPITVGEEPKAVRQRAMDQQVSETYLKSNEKRTWLPSDRVVASPNRPSLEKASQVKTIMEQGLSPRGNYSPNNTMSELLKARKTGTMGSVLEQSGNSDSKFKAAAATKVNEMEYKTVVRNINTDKTFARTKVDLHHHA